MKFIFLNLTVIFAVLLAGCSQKQTTPETPEDIIQRASQQKIFYAPYDEVWKAAHATLKYTIASENQDFGVIETDYIKAVDGWLPPFRAKPEYPSSRYKIVMSFAKGQKSKGKESVRVTIEKKLEVFRDFISEVKTVNSDGFEERVIFYRMEREIIIAQALKKALTQP